jgi:hypothetical protein
MLTLQQLHGEQGAANIALGFKLCSAPSSAAMSTVRLWIGDTQSDLPGSRA